MRIYELKARCDQEDHWPLFERLIGHTVRPNTTIKSPLREEKNASFGLYRATKDGRVRFKDFGDKDGDIYDYVAALHGNNISMRERIEIVARMLDIRPGKYEPPTIRKKIILRQAVNERPTETRFVARNWEGRDDDFWGLFGVPINLLDEFNVVPVDVFSLRGKDDQWRTWNSGFGFANVMYVYQIGKHHKLYRPFAEKKSRYIGNTDRNDVFGLDRLEKRAELYGVRIPAVINAGQKDALVMMARYHVNAVSFNSENGYPSPEYMQRIHQASSSVHVLYDNDATGRKYSEKLVQSYPFVHRIDLSRYTGLKDPADCVKAGDTHALKQLELYFHGFSN